MRKKQIKHPEIKHFIKLNSYSVLAPQKGFRQYISYLCCGSYTPEKTTEFSFKVTCKNCKSILKKMKEKNE